MHFKKAVALSAVTSAITLAALFVETGRAQQAKGKAQPTAKAKAKPVPAGDWPLYSRDLASTRYSPLTQINTQNVAQLKQAWTYKPDRKSTRLNSSHRL